MFKKRIINDIILTMVIVLLYCGLVTYNYRNYYLFCIEKMVKLYINFQGEIDKNINKPR